MTKYLSINSSIRPTASPNWLDEEAVVTTGPIDFRQTQRTTLTPLQELENDSNIMYMSPHSPAPSSSYNIKLYTTTTTHSPPPLTNPSTRQSLTTDGVDIGPSGFKQEMVPSATTVPPIQEHQAVASSNASDNETMEEFAGQLTELIETNKKILETLLHQLSVQSAMLQQMLRAATTFTEVAQLAEMSTTSESFK